MPAPLVYSEAQLADFMARELGTGTGTVGDDLGPLILGDLESAVWDVVARYGAAAIVDATSMPKLQAIARARVWAWAVDRYVTRYRDSTEGQTLDRQQLYEHALERSKYWEGQVAVMSSLTPGSTTARRPTMFTVASGCRGR